MRTLTLHDVAANGHLIGVECHHCMHYALLGALKDKAKKGDMRTLQEAGLYCGICKSTRFKATRFQTRIEAQAFMKNVRSR